MAKNINTLNWVDDEVKKLETLRFRFPNHTFVNQKWEILNFIASFRFREKNVCVSDVYHALDYPRESVIRIIESFVKSGIVEKINDPTDKRRKNLILTNSTQDVFNHISEGL